MTLKQFPKDVSDRLPTVPLTEEIGTPLLVLLLTRSYTNWLDDNQAFLQEAVDRVFEPSQSIPEVNVLTAVVDALPSLNRKPWTRDDQKLGIVENVSFEGGQEGAAILIADTATIAPDLFSPFRKPDESNATGHNEQSSISFHLRPDKAIRELSPNRLGVGKDTSYEIELPLANTVFQNGRVSTMSASRWTRSGISGPVLFTKTKSTALHHQRIFIPLSDTYGNRRAHYLEAPLRTLTSAWVVASAMGNIIRQLYTDATASATMPASEGLEAAVTAFFEQSTSTSDHFTVWALVTPKERWIDEPIAGDPTILSCLETGSRLHRVWSGGGGYGKKLGLLSLDPDTAYTSKTNSSPSRTAEDFDEDSMEALSQVAKPGDVVQFFIYVHHDKGVHHPQPKDMSHPHAEIDFGTIPSTIDSSPDPAPATAKKHQGKRVEYRKNVFGALSEQGLSVTIETHGPEGVKCIGAERIGRVVQSKLDVPYTRYRYRAYTKQNPSIPEVEPPPSVPKNGKESQSVEEQKIPGLELEEALLGFRKLRITTIGEKTAPQNTPVKIKKYPVK